MRSGREIETLQETQEVGNGSVLDPKVKRGAHQNLPTGYADIITAIRTTRGRVNHRVIGPRNSRRRKTRRSAVGVGG